MAIRFLDTILSGSLSISGSYTLPPIDTGSTGVLGQIGMSAEVPYFYSSQGWQIVSGSEAYSSPPPSANIEYLVIAGGGGGSSGIGNGNGTGGGGAGGMLSSSLSSIESGSSITVTVGAGGNGGTPSTYAGRSSAQRGTDGADSSLASAAGTSFTTVTAVGGGSGGRYYGDNTGNDGGSGGGGASYSGAGGSGTAGQGNDGGVATPSGDSTYRGGGGGGKSEAGATGAASGNGGAGQASNITDTAVNYAGGGGGGTYTAAGGSGGTGGGGAGSNQANTAGSGTANTGGGGGGGGWPGSSTSTGGQGGAGGKGVAILAYDSGSISAKGGVARSRSDGHVYHTFNSSGTLTVGGASDFTLLNGDNFGFLQWDGDNANPRSVTGLGFDPGMVWVKNTVSSGENWALGDVLRTTGKILYPNLTLAQTSGEYITPITDGVKITTGNNNYSSNSYTAWCWKAGGSGVSNSDGTGITSTVSVNTAAGFSIVKWDATTTVSHTVGHGLSAKPELIIMKNASNGSTNWFVYSDIFDGSLDYFYLNSNAAKANSTRNVPTATVFDQGNLGGVSAGNVCVAYCFHSVPGYSKISTYEGNQSAGHSINVGFQPRFVALRGVDAVESWIVHSAVTGMDGTNHIRFNTSGGLDNGANEAISFTSTGFSITTAGATQVNTSGNTYLYWAIA